MDKFVNSSKVALLSIVAIVFALFANIFSAVAANTQSFLIILQLLVQVPKLDHLKRLLFTLVKSIMVKSNQVPLIHLTFHKPQPVKLVLKALQVQLLFH